MAGVTVGKTLAGLYLSVPKVLIRYHYRDEHRLLNQCWGAGPCYGRDFSQTQVFGSDKKTYAEEKVAEARGWLLVRMMATQRTGKDKPVLSCS